MNLLVEIVVFFFLEPLLWIVLLLIAWLVSTPVILVAAAFRPEPYGTAIAKMYGTVTGFWKKRGSRYRERSFFR
jgi:hypothetical protein